MLSIWTNENNSNKNRQAISQLLIFIMKFRVVRRGMTWMMSATNLTYYKIKKCPWYCYIQVSIYTKCF